MKPVFSVIVPVYNETDCMDELYRRVKAVMEQTKETWELVLVDDGSTDGSSDIIRKYAKTDAHIRPVIFARNYGHQIAVTAGMDYSRGDAVIVIDADLQDPPEVMAELIAKWREGFEVVYAVRDEREGESWFKLFTASMFYRIIYKITEIKIPMNSGDFRLLDRKVVNVMNTMRERQRFLRGMSIWTGFRQVGVPYKRAARFAGRSKYPLKKMLKLAITAITSFSSFPLQMAIYAGGFITAVSFIFLVVMIILRLSGSAFLAGQASTLIVVAFLGGIQLIFMGILGEYIGRIYDEVKGRPLYTTRETPSDETK
jgi:dolichol-phosphate mannosyltransferase